MQDLYNQYNDKIFNLAYRMTGNREDARDITQETFIKAYLALDDFKGESHIYTWLYKIARNYCLRFLEKKKKSSFLSIEELLNRSVSTISTAYPKKTSSPISILPLTLVLP